MKRWPPISGGHATFITHLAGAISTLPCDLIEIVFDYYPQTAQCTQPTLCFDDSYGMHHAAYCALPGRCWVCCYFVFSFDTGYHEGWHATGCSITDTCYQS